jgi:hypothetical protein
MNLNITVSALVLLKQYKEALGVVSNHIPDGKSSKCYDDLRDAVINGIKEAGSRLLPKDALSTDAKVTFMNHVNSCFMFACECIHEEMSPEVYGLCERIIHQCYSTLNQCRIPREQRLDCMQDNDDCPVPPLHWFQNLSTKNILTKKHKSH